VEAANTLIVTPDGGLHAANTDWQGFADDLRAHSVDVDGMDCLVLGTGGSAGAVAYALHQMGSASITFASRDPGRRSDIVGYDGLARFSHVDLVVNCTPVGMHPHVDASPWPDGVRFPPGATLYDLVYNPARTRLMGQAEAAGARAIGGLGMLVRQGALAFTQWTGRTPPPGVMQDAARRALKEQTIESNMV
jgi:shikimate dehydrogenase